MIIVVNLTLIMTMIVNLSLIMIVPQSGKVATVRWNPPTVGSHSGFKLKVIFLFSFDENQIGKRSSEGILPYGKCWAEGWIKKRLISDQWSYEAELKEEMMQWSSSAIIGQFVRKLPMARLSRSQSQGQPLGTLSSARPGEVMVMMMVEMMMMTRMLIVIIIIVYCSIFDIPMVLRDIQYFQISPIIFNCHSFPNFLHKGHHLPFSDLHYVTSRLGQRTKSNCSR